mmetsp:Transcript_122979/g.244711  ORF Transcript_122979/g.244711 Transcript_122979/m.244711 type:complete len:135 (-) Transcript_122979:30-434(-)|eukprot:CAMPEP_0172722668 /NCGR_PEP_ID=MMETSP1074-20121228/82011_1 /TAXON_ID=2916 /ORGANISM="Ceratium fusus, Strain PA161109" /LENGTH=134 /DNA_ID=CAMNT_0013548723 /DNA_START=622 /DNA_END=1026 /DNA_ORIENTATION=-
MHEVLDGTETIAVVLGGGDRNAVPPIASPHAVLDGMLAVARTVVGSEHVTMAVAQAWAGGTGGECNNMAGHGATLRRATIGECGGELKPLYILPTSGNGTRLTTAGDRAPDIKTKSKSLQPGVGPPFTCPTAAF